MIDEDDEPSDEGEPVLESETAGLSLLERIPLALKVLMAAELAGRVQAAESLATAPANLVTDPSAATAKKLTELSAAFAKDLETLSQKWMRALGPVAADEEEAKAQMDIIMVAAHTALGVRYHLVHSILRMSRAKEVMQTLDRQARDTARAFLRRPTDGQRGIRRVK